MEAALLLSAAAWGRRGGGVGRRGGGVKADCSGVGRWSRGRCVKAA